MDVQDRWKTSEKLSVFTENILNMIMFTFDFTSRKMEGSGIYVVCPVFTDELSYRLNVAHQFNDGKASKTKTLGKLLFFFFLSFPFYDE